MECIRKTERNQGYEHDKKAIICNFLACGLFKDMNIFTMPKKFSVTRHIKNLLSKDI